MGAGDEYIMWRSGQCEWTDSKGVKERFSQPLKDKQADQLRQSFIKKKKSQHSKSAESINLCPVVKC